MFDTRFNNGYQNTVMPLNTDTYLNQMPQNSYGQNPYAQGSVLSNMMSNNAPYPTPPSQSFPAANMQNPNKVSYADGGAVKKKKNKAENSPYPMLAEMIRKQGKGEDTILAHINPLEAMILKDLGGSGTINPKTGLPQFGGSVFDKIMDVVSFVPKTIGRVVGGMTGTKGGMLGSSGSYWDKKGAGGFRGDLSNTLSYGLPATVGMKLLPKKSQKGMTSFGQKYVIPTAAAVIGNTFLPGIGGTIGGTLGGTAGAGLRGSSLGEGALRGGTIGTLLPSAASLGGSAASSLGFNSLGSSLSNYGTQNAILPSMGRLLGMENTGNSFLSNAGGSRNILSNLMGGKGEGATTPRMFEANDQGSALENYNRYQSGVSAGDGDESFTDKLLGNTKDFLTKPKNLLTLASVASSFANRPKEKKEKTPEQLADEQKRLERALRLSPADRAGMEANLLAEEQMRRRIARQKFLPEERLGNIEPMYRKSNTPEEYKKHGKWLSYYNNPEFSGEPIPYKKGGSTLPNMMYEAEEMERPLGLGRYIAGDTNGQDDKIQALLSDGEYVIPADVVAHLGDGNNTAGAKKLDMGLKKIRKHKGGVINKLPPKAKSLASYLK